jgi:outer membrane receptor protein involved in Fe transport
MARPTASSEIHDEQVALGYNHQMSENKFVDARLALSGTKAGKWTKAIGNTDITASEIPGLPTIAGVSGGLPSMAITGGFTSFGRQSTNPQWQNPSVLDPKVNFSWIKGKHSLKFGYEFEYVWMEVEDSNPLYGSFTFSGGLQWQLIAAGKESTWADFLYGASSGYSLSTYWISHLHQSMDSAYAQDDWKVTPKLTLNLGLRWEYGSPYSERNNNLSNFDPTTGTMKTLTPGLYIVASDLRHGGVHHRIQRRRRLWQEPGQSRPDRLRAARGLCLCADAQHCSPRRLWHQLYPLLPRRLRQYAGHQRAQSDVHRGTNAESSDHAS